MKRRSFLRLAFLGTGAGFLGASVDTKPEAPQAPQGPHGAQVTLEAHVKRKLRKDRAAHLASENEQWGRILGKETYYPFPDREGGIVVPHKLRADGTAFRDHERAYVRTYEPSHRHQADTA